VDGDVGAAGSTGRGEANLYNLCSYLIVEEMRRGAHPKDAALAALKRVAKNTIEKRLLNSRGQPNFGLNFYVLNKKGEYAGVAMYQSTYSVCTENGPQSLRPTRCSRGEPPTDRVRSDVMIRPRRAFLQLLALGSGALAACRAKAPAPLPSFLGAPISPYGERSPFVHAVRQAVRPHADARSRRRASPRSPTPTASSRPRRSISNAITRACRRSIRRSTA
jgi:hypothetical protein